MKISQQILGSDAPAQSLISATDVPSLAVEETGAPVLSPTKRILLNDSHWEFAGFQEEYVRSYISLADTKAAWSFTIATAVLAYLFGQNSAQLLFLKLEWSLGLALLLSSAILLMISALYSFRVVAPRLRSLSGEGIIFFGSVAAEPSASKYVSAVAAKDKRALTEARLMHCYDVSRVCSAKYAALKKAIWLGVPGLALAITYLLAM